MLALAWMKLGNTSTAPFFHGYLLFECLMMLRLFGLLLGKSIASRWLRVAGATFALAWFTNLAVGDGLMALPTWIRPLEAILLVSLAVRYFLKIMSEGVVRNPAKTFGFWVSTGVLIFFSGNMLLFVFSKTVSDLSGRAYLAIWEVHAALAILLYLIYTLAIVWARKNPTSS